MNKHPAPAPDLPKPTARQVRDEKVAAKADQLFRAGGYDLPEAVIEALHEVDPGPGKTPLTRSQKSKLWGQLVSVLSVLLPVLGACVRFALWEIGFGWL